MGKVSLLGCSHPKLVYPHPSTRAAVREGSKSASTLFTPALFSKLPEGPQQKAGEKRCHFLASTIPGGAQRMLGEQGDTAGSTSSHSQPRAGTQSRDTILHSHPHNSCPI